MDEFKYGERCYYRWWGHGSMHVFSYRLGSVPGIKRWRSGRARYNRNPPARLQAASSYIADEDDYQVLTSYQIKRITKFRVEYPDPWDDIPRTRQGDNWKRYRKTQYK